MLLIAQISHLYIILNTEILSLRFVVHFRQQIDISPPFLFLFHPPA